MGCTSSAAHPIAPAADFNKGDLTPTVSTCPQPRLKNVLANPASPSPTSDSPDRVPYFHSVLKFFDLQPSNNPFYDVYVIYSRLYDLNRFMLRISRTIFEHYDSNEDGFIDLREFRRFWIDLMKIMGQRPTQADFLEVVDEITLVLREKCSTLITFEIFVETKLLEKEMKKNLAVLFCDDESELEALSLASPLGRKRLTEGDLSFARKLKADSIVDQFTDLLKFFEIPRTENFLLDVYRVKQSFGLTGEDEAVLKDNAVVEQKILGMFVQHIFESYDENEDGYLQRHELRDFVRDVHKILPDQEEDQVIEIDELVDMFISDVDEDKDSLISRDEISKSIPVIFARIKEETSPKKGRRQETANEELPKDTLS